MRNGCFRSRNNVKRLCICGNKRKNPSTNEHWLRFGCSFSNKWIVFLVIVKWDIWSFKWVLHMKQKVFIFLFFCIVLKLVKCQYKNAFLVPINSWHEFAICVVCNGKMIGKHSIYYQNKRKHNVTNRVVNKRPWFNYMHTQQHSTSKTQKLQQFSVECIDREMKQKQIA